MTTIFKNSILGRLKRGQRELSVSSEKTGRYEKMHWAEEERFKRGQRELPSWDERYLKIWGQTVKGPVILVRLIRGRSIDGGMCAIEMLKGDDYSWWWRRRAQPTSRTHSVPTRRIRGRRVGWEGGYVYNIIIIIIITTPLQETEGRFSLCDAILGLAEGEPNQRPVLTACWHAG